MSNIVELGASDLDQNTGALTAQCKGVALGEDEDDAPDYGPVMVASCLGISARHYPRTDEGSAEGVILDDVPGLDAVVVGARDLRSAKIVGNLKPGDTVLHSTGPQQAAQVQCKEEKRQVANVTKDSRGKTMINILDGAGDQWVVSGFGMSIEMSREQGIVMTTGKATIQITKGGQIVFDGEILHGRAPNPALRFMLGPLTGSPGGAAAAPLVAAKGIYGS